MLELDGSAGGGQLLRTALSLSAVAGEPFRMTDVRGGRETPGLRPQHVAAVRAMAEVVDAEVSDVDVGSDDITFEPGAPAGGTYEVDIGTAGSATLLADAILPLSTRLAEPLAVRVVGGTDVKWSPPVDALRFVKLPLLRRAGLQASVEVDRRGFYPAGGGAVTLRLAPSTLRPLALTDRGELAGARVYSVASASLAENDVAGRQASAARERLEGAGVEVLEWSATHAATRSPGSAVVVRLDYEGSLAGFDALGERGRPAEDVAGDAVDAALAFDDGPGAVDAHLADQLVVVLALAGGAVDVPVVTDHAETSVELVRAFGYDVAIEDRDGGHRLTAPAG